MKKICISLIGDIFPANMDYNIGFGIASIYKKKGFIWEKQITGYLQNSDIVIGNLEAPLLKEVNVDKISFAGYTKFAKELKDCGVNVLNVANNHILEYGSSGFKTTLKYLDQYGILHIGSFYQNNNPLILKKGNLKIGIAGFNQVHDIPNEGNYVELNYENSLNTISYFKKKSVDLIIFSLHFGWHQEYVNIPSPNNIELARKLIDAGVDIIHGHHSHSIQPIEFYKEGIILYSLGNFLFDMFWSKNVRTGLVVEVNVDNKNITINTFNSRLNLSGDIQKFKTKIYNKDYKHFSIQLYDFNKKIYTHIYKLFLMFASYYERLKMKIFIIRNWNLLKKSVKKQILQKLKLIYHVK